MTTLYIREVPESVAQTLKSRAAAQGQSLSVYVNSQLATIAARPSNADIATRLRMRDRTESVPTQRIVEEIQAARR